MDHKAKQEAKAAGSMSNTVTQDKQQQPTNGSNTGNGSKAGAASLSSALTRHEDQKGMVDATINGADNGSKADAAPSSSALTQGEGQKGAVGATVNGAAASVALEDVDAIDTDGTSAQKQDAETPDYARTYK